MESTNKERNDEIIKSPFGSQHSNSYFRQESSMDAETNRWKFYNRIIYIASKYLSTNYLLIIKVKNSNFLKQPGKHLWYEEGQRATMYLLLWYWGHNITSEIYLIKMCSLNVIVRNIKKAQIESLYKINGLYYSKLLSQERQGNSHMNCSRLKETYATCDLWLNRGPEGRIFPVSIKDINRTTGQMWVRFID